MPAMITTFNFLASLINGNLVCIYDEIIFRASSFNFLASLINGNQMFFGGFYAVRKLLTS